MSLIRTHSLAYAFERKILARLRALKVSRPLAVAEALAADLIDEVPVEAFEPRDPSEIGIVFYHGDVDEKKVGKCQSALMEAHLNIDKKLPITLYLSSFGGSVFAGLAMVSTIQEIRRNGRKVNCHIQGCAMSMGSLIAQACDLRTIEPQAWFMLHEIRHWLPGVKTAELRDEADFAERLESQTFALYANRTSKPVEYWRKKLHRRDWFLTAEEAVNESLVDEIASTPAYPRFRKRKAA